MSVKMPAKLYLKGSSPNSIPIPLALPSSEKMRLNQRHKSAKIVFDEFSSGPHPPQKMTNTLKNKMAFDWVVKNDDDDDWCGGNLEGVLCPTQLEARPIC